jgi:hypothetical protein
MDFLKEIFVNRTSDAGAMQILMDIIEFSVLDVKMMAFPGLFLMVGL